MDETIERRAGWSEYQQLVLAELKHLRDEINAINSKMDLIKETNYRLVTETFRDVNKDIGQLKTEIALIQGKAAAYGSVAGLAAALIFHLLKL